MKKRLAGKTVLVAGASKGIGRATALALAAEGADVAVTAREAAALSSLIPLIEAEGVRAVSVAADGGLFGFPGETAYCASKHAHVGFAKALDREVFDKGVRVSVIALGGVNTEHAFGTGRTAGDPALQTFLEPEDVAQSVLFAVTQPPKSRTFLIGMRPSCEGYYA